MTIRFSKRPARVVPLDRPTFADLSVLPENVRKPCWGVRTPRKMKCRRGDGISVTTAYGNVRDVELVDKIYSNDDFNYWTTMTGWWDDDVPCDSLLEGPRFGDK